MATTVTTGALSLPANLAQGLIKQVETGSAVAALSASKPLLFGNTQVVTFTKHPRAEFVEEGAAKSPADVEFGTVTAVPHKAQVTVRFDEEVLWADEDRKMGVFQAIADAGATALSRALDLGVFHRINPSTGAVMTGWTNYLTATTKTVTDTGDTDVDLEKAIGLVLNDGEGWDVNGIALSKPEAFKLATTRDKQGHPLYPELGYGTAITSFKGIKATVTTTVNAPEAATATGVEAIVGDFAGGIYWGVQRELPLELISYGDPDGLGDLKRHNQIAYRLEVMYAWHVDQSRFAVVKAAAGSPGE
jgi:HK97 family phage major capsid protein